MVDIPTGQVVTNDYAQMPLDLSTEWQAFHRPGAPELYPHVHRDEIDEVAKAVFTDVNNGVYRCGFAKRHYYVVHTDINPTRIVPAGPALARLTPHGERTWADAPR